MPDLSVAQGTPMVEAQISISSFDAQTINGKLETGEAIQLLRSAIKSPMVSGKFQYYEISVEEWSQAKITSSKKSAK